MHLKATHNCQDLAKGCLKHTGSYPAADMSSSLKAPFLHIFLAWFILSSNVIAVTILFSKSLALLPDQFISEKLFLFPFNHLLMIAGVFKSCFFTVFKF